MTDITTQALDPSQPLSGRIGVLLVNLGTPDATDYWAMRRYLKEFLSDRRVIETPRLLWWPILNLAILSTRPRASGRNYASVWNKELNEGPLKTITRAQADKLKARVAAGALGLGGDRVIVDWAMRYANPSIAARVAALAAQGCERLLVVPLYPQYCAATTATVADSAFAALATMRFQPALRVAAPWGDEPFYIDALARSIRSQWGDREPQALVASFHGIPKSYSDAGDPYAKQCGRTAALLQKALALPDERFLLTFQSRFGPREWLQPYTDATMKALPNGASNASLSRRPASAPIALRRSRSWASKTRITSRTPAARITFASNASTIARTAWR